MLSIYILKIIQEKTNTPQIPAGYLTQVCIEFKSDESLKPDYAPTTLTA